MRSSRSRSASRRSRASSYARSQSTSELARNGSSAIVAGLAGGGVTSRMPSAIPRVTSRRIAATSRRLLGNLLTGRPQPRRRATFAQGHLRRLRRWRRWRCQRCGRNRPIRRFGHVVSLRWSRGASFTGDAGKIGVSNGGNDGPACRIGCVNRLSRTNALRNV